MDATLFSKYSIKNTKTVSERAVIIGELFTYIDEEDRKQPFYKDKSGKLRKKKLYTIKKFAVLMSPHSVEELYYLKSVCLDAQKRGGSFCKKFFYEIKIK